MDGWMDDDDGAMPRGCTNPLFDIIIVMN